MTEDELFAAALEKGTPEERAAFLAQACAGDSALRKRVEELLASHLEVGDFLLQPALAGAGTGAFAPEPLPETVGVGPIKEEPGTLIGPYKLLQQIGEGGMGVVYMAEQEKPVRRRVALKIIKPGMDTALVVARFEAERQALALMDHPNIAKVFDAGATDTGRSYFVMELVKGVSITKFCDQQHLTPRERLDLFLPVCQAVQHAHQKGVIHRDLKPTNVLIALYDGKPVPKVIDFGVAKATSQKLTERTMFTALGSIVGTLEYMAPEQAELNNLDIDTRADIYSLGVLLYELLTGQPPFTGRQLRSAGFTEMLRLIREEEPPKPSTKLSHSDELPAIAANRKLEPAKLTRLVRGELDWIVMKALEKERSRRYETANALALDLQRFLNDEPVLAGPPSTRYRLQKFVRRHRGPVLAVSIILLALIAGIVGTTFGLVQAVAAGQTEAEARRREGERADAEEVLKKEALKQAKLAEEARANEERERRRAQQDQAISAAVRDFLQNDILRAADSRYQADRNFIPNPSLTVREALDRAANDIDRRFKGEPLVEAAVRSAIGDAYEGVGQLDKAIHQLRLVQKLREANLEEGDPLTLESMNDLAEAFRIAWKLPDALALHKETLERREKRFGKGSRLYNESLNNLAMTYLEDGKIEEAIARLRQVVEIATHDLGDEARDTLIAKSNLGLAFQFAGKIHEAVELMETTHKAAKRSLGEDHPETLSIGNGLGTAYLSAGQVTDAIKVEEQVVTLRQKRLGEHHPATLCALGNLADMYRADGRYEEAVSMLKVSYDGCKDQLGEECAETMFNANNLAAACRDAGRLAEAHSLIAATAKHVRATFDADHPFTLRVTQNLAACLKDLGRYQESVDLLENVLKRSRTKLGEDHHMTLGSAGLLAESYLALGKSKEALALMYATFDRCTKVLGKDHPYTLQVMLDLAEGYHGLGQFEKADDFLKRCLELTRGKFGDDHPRTFVLIGCRAVVSRDAGNRKILPQLEDCLERCRSKLSEDHPVTMQAQDNLAETRRMAHEFPEALRLHDENYKKRKARLGAVHPNTLISMSNLGLTYWEAGRAKTAIPILKECLDLTENELGKEHLQTLKVVNNLALAYRDGGEPAKSLPMFDRVLDGMKLVFAADHPHRLQVQGNLIEACLQIGEYERAAEALADRLQATGAMPKDGTEVVQTKAYYGFALLKLKKYAEAEPLLRDALTVREKKDSDYWATFHTKSMLGASLLGQKQYEVAEPLLLNAYEGMKSREKQMSPQARPRLTEAIEYLVQLYDETDRKDLAEEWRKKLKGNDK
jgi:serine/threonine protein kinase/lipopolysaccharide biosynthesis regulator YciM